MRGPSTSCLKFPLRDVTPQKNLYWEDEGQRFVFHYFFKLTRVIDSTYLGPWSSRPVSLKGTQGAYCSSGRICCENGWSPCITISHDALEKTNTRQASLSITNSRSLPKLMSVESVMPSNHLVLCCPFLLSPSIFPSIRVFSDESALYIRWPKYWSFSFNISPSNEHSGQISLRTDLLDLLAVKGTIRSLLQHHSSKVSVL